MNFKFCLAVAGMLAAWVAGAQTTAFTYQGQLANGGSAASGLYDLRFSLVDANTNLVGGPVTNVPVGVTNGLFVATVNLGSAAFNGGGRWLEIGVRPYGNTNAYTVLAPNQAVTATPYAIQALNAAGLSAPLVATNIAGLIAVANLPTNVALLNSNEVFAGAVTATNYYGSGAGLTNVLATSLTGILPDSLLSSNVARLNTNATFASNVTAVLFTGAGHGLTNVPGAFFWLTVNGTNAQASSNLGFIATNNVAPVFINLPTNAVAGDTFRVAGAGAGGWILKQNAGQQVLAGNLADTTGLNWTAQTNAGLNNWTGLASSSDGTKLVAISYGYIYYSANSGVTWTNEDVPSSPLYWSSVAASTDGSHLIATVGTAAGTTNGNIWISANYGVSWAVAETTLEPWVACASSASGTYLAAVSYNGILLVSTNGGSTWGGLSGGPDWTGVACSANGMDVYACSTAGGGAYVWASTNYGVSFFEATNSGLHQWTAIACSADGTRLVATATGSTGGGGIYESANGGATWSTQYVSTVSWDAVASSSDGSHLAAVYDGGSLVTPGYVYTSSDSGSTWLERLGAPNKPWTSIASSADGSKLAAAAYGGYIYTSGQGSTSSGTNGYLMGGYQSALEIQYVGNGLFIPLSHEGTLTAY